MAQIQEQLRDSAEAFADEPVREGRMTKAIENQTSKIPSVAFLTAGLASISISLVMKAFRRDTATSNFIGLWVPTFLLMGIYNKLVKIEGNDRYDRT